MQTSRRLLNGDLISLDVPDASALPPSTTVAVVEVDAGELELTSGDPAALDFFLSSTGTTLTGQTTLTGGHTLRHGPLGGDPANGLAFAIEIGEHRIFGSAPPTPGLEKLSAWLAKMTFRPTAQGPTVTLRGPTWSPTRTFALAQHVALADTEGYLLDVRRARGAAPKKRLPAGAGIAVRGGRLMRSPKGDERRHVVLDAPEVVCYGIPLSSSSLDDVARSMADVKTELR